MLVILYKRLLLCNQRSNSCEPGLIEEGWERRMVVEVGLGGGLFATAFSS